jgi:hypothetical protein
MTLQESALFRAAAFAIADPPGPAGRALMRRRRGIELDPRNAFVGAAGAPLGLVRRARRRPGELLYDFVLEVVDPGGDVLLRLPATQRSLSVRYAGGPPVGIIQNAGFRRERRGERPTRMHVSLRQAGPDGYVEVGTLAEREPYRRYAPPGLSRILDLAGDEVATVTSADFRHTVAVSSAASDPLRTLAVAYACSLVEHRWLVLRAAKGQ